MKLFLTARHWIMFLIIFIIPSVVYFLAMGFSLATENPFFLMVLFPPIVLFSTFMLFGWLWSIGNGLHDRVPAGVTLPVRKFRNLLFFAAGYMVIFMFSIFLLFAFNFDTFFSYASGAGMFLVLPLHLITIFCILYALYFDARTIKSIELGRSAEFSEYLPEIILLWFWPVGIWILQPRINRIAENAEKTL